MIKGIIQKIKNETKKQIFGLLGKILGTVCAFSLGIMLVGNDAFSAGNGVYRAGKDFQLHLIL